MDQDTISTVAQSTVIQSGPSPAPTVFALTPPPATAPAINYAAATDPTHPTHNYHVGQILASVLLGLQVYSSVKATGVSSLTNPGNVAQLAAGFTNIWLGQS